MLGGCPADQVCRSFALADGVDFSESETNVAEAGFSPYSVANLDWGPVNCHPNTLQTLDLVPDSTTV